MKEGIKQALTSSWVMQISWKFCWWDRVAMSRARACASPALFGSSRLVVGSSRAKMPHRRQKDSASASLITMPANMHWPAEQRPLISRGASPFLITTESYHSMGIQYSIEPLRGFIYYY